MIHRAHVPVVCGLVLSVASVAGAQLSGPPAAPTPAAPTGQRPGLIRLGPIYLTPRLHIGHIGLDSNVFLVGGKSRTDVTATAGPTLEMVVPAGRSLRFTAEGGADYIYFVRAKDQRQLVANARAAIDWKRPRTQLQLEGAHRETFERPSSEIDVRVSIVHDSLGASLERRLGSRTGVTITTSFTREDSADQTFLGTDLARTLSRDTYAATSALEYALTVKTRLFVEGRHRRYQFFQDSTRDATSWIGGLGIAASSSTFFSGRVFLGAQRHEPRKDVAPLPWAPYVEIDITYHVSPRTQITGIHTRGLRYTAFVPVSGAPALHSELYALRLRKELWRQLGLGLAAGRTLTRTDQPVRLSLTPDETIEAVRRDVAYDASGILDYGFGRRLRIGLIGTYVRRESSIRGPSVSGLVLGATIGLNIK